jgi:hypothetical protein
MQRRCADRPISRFEPLWQFRVQGGWSMGKTRERQIILKSDHRMVILELGVGGKFQAKSSGWDGNRMFLEGEFLKCQYARADG